MDWMKTGTGMALGLALGVAFWVASRNVVFVGGGVALGSALSSLLFGTSSRRRRR